LIFRDFVFGDKLLLYKDIGSDSVNFHYPYFIYLSDYLRSSGLPSWSFSVGMGQSLFPYISSLLFDPVVWLPRWTIAHALVYQHFLKLVLVGVLFYKFLRLRGLSFREAFLGSLLISFSAYMCMGSCWTNIGNEVVIFAFVLFASEHALASGRWIYVSFAVACCGLLTPFHLYLCAILLSFYVPARLIETNRWPFASSFRTCTHLALAGCIGVGLAAIVWLDVLSTILNSPRGSGTASYINKLSAVPVFAVERQSHYLTAMLRWFSNDMIGTASSFRGWQNYLEAPMSYCGLICLLMLPQVFIGTGKRQRFSYGLFLALISVPVVFPWFRYLFWLFQGDYYRTFTLFSVFGVITLSVTALFHYVQRAAINLYLLCVTFLVLISILYLPIRGIDPALRNVAACFLGTYVILLTAGRYFKREAVCSWIILGLSAIELCYFSRITIADRSTVTKPELKQRVGYNDYTVEAVRDIESADHSFYRITKLYPSGPSIHASNNDAMVFGYYGTRSYSSFNNLNYIKFLISVNALDPDPSETSTRWAHGLTGRPNLSKFACEKYVLTRNPVPVQLDPAYEKLGLYDKIYVFRNKLFLPLGLFYLRYMSEKEFANLPTPTKEEALLRAAILPQDDTAPFASLLQMTSDSLQDAINKSSFKDVVTAHAETALRVDSLKQNRIQGMISCLAPGILIFQMPFDRGWKVFVDGTRSQGLKVDNGLLGVQLTPGQHAVKIQYLPALLPIGASITAAALLLFLIGLWFWPRIYCNNPGSLPRDV
jgi:uncharacterized membrane protein YfhO